MSVFVGNPEDRFSRDATNVELISICIKGEIQYTSRAGICVCVRRFTLSNMNISATSRLIGMKFYLKHHWGGGKDSAVFDPD